MRQTDRWAGILGASAVAVGAYAAHGLEAALGRGQLPAEEIMQRVEWCELAVRYQLWHAIALLALGSRRATIAQVLWIVGVVLFSGSLYAMTATGYTKLGMVTPLGGLSLMGGWVAVCCGRAGPKPLGDSRDG